MGRRASLALVLCLSRALAEDNSTTATLTTTSASESTATTSATATTTTSESSATTSATETSSTSETSGPPTTTATDTTSATTATTTATSTSVPLSVCDEAYLTFVAAAEAACAPQGGETLGGSESLEGNETLECPAQCAAAWRSLYDACAGQNISFSPVFGIDQRVSPHPFDAVQFVAIAVPLAVRRAGEVGPCAAAPLAAFWISPAVELDCADSVTLLRAGISACGPGRVCGSQTCQDVLQTPFEACSPQQLVPLQPDVAGTTVLVTASTQVVGEGPRLGSAECQATFDAGAVQWFSDAGWTCDAKLLMLSKEQRERGFVCSQRDDVCDPTCAQSLGSLYDACDGQNTTLLDGRGQVVEFHTAGLAAQIVVSAEPEELPGACRSVPISAALAELEGPQGELGCGDAAALFDASPFLCGGPNATDECSSFCADLIERQFRSCEPTEQIPASSLSFRPDRLVTARSRLAQVSPSLSPACSAVFQPRYDLWESPPSTTREASGDATTEGTTGASPTAAPAINGEAESSSACGLARALPAAIVSLALLSAP